MILKWLLSLFMFPVKWFWERYQKCKEANAVWKMVLLFLMSLTGIAVVGILSFLIVSKIIEWSIANPLWVLGSAAVYWFYIYVRDKNMAEINDKNEIDEKNLIELQTQAEQGYATMANVLYQTFRAAASEIGGVVPGFMGEIEIPEGRYRLRDSICLYQFMLEKQDVQSLYDENMLTEFKNILQFKLRSKLQAGAFPSVKIEHFRDLYGNGYDGVVIDTIEDFGKYFVIYSAYASPKYAEYLHQRNLLKTQRVVNSSELTTSWNDK